MRLWDVAEHLTQEGLRLDSTDAQDFFLRSAVNRYYYDIFYQTRELMLKLQIWDFERERHKQLPLKLEKEVLALVDKHAHLIYGLGGDSHRLADSLKARARSAAKGQAQLLKRACEERVKADYDPEVQSEIRGEDFRISRIWVSDLRTWSDKSHANLSDLYDVLEALALV